MDQSVTSVTGPGLLAPMQGEGRPATPIRRSPDTLAGTVVGSDGVTLFRQIGSQAAEPVQSPSGVAFQTTRLICTRPGSYLTSNEKASKVGAALSRSTTSSTTTSSAAVVSIALCLRNTDGSVAIGATASVACTGSTAFSSLPPLSQAENVRSATATIGMTNCLMGCARLSGAVPGVYRPPTARARSEWAGGRPDAVLPPRRGRSASGGGARVGVAHGVGIGIERKGAPQSPL